MVKKVPPSGAAAKKRDFDVAFENCERKRGTLCLDELYVDNNPASEEATHRVIAFFGGGDDDATRAAQTKKPADARQVCESLSVSIYSGLGSSCVVQ